MPSITKEQQQELTTLISKAIGEELEQRGITQEKWFDAFFEKLTSDKDRKYNLGGIASTKDAAESLFERVGKIYSANRNADAEKLKTLTIGVDTDGGYIVPTQFVPELINEVTKHQTIRDLVRVLPVTTLTGKVPKLTGGTTLFNIDEVGSYSPESGGSAQPTFGSVPFTIRKWGGLIPMSAELNEDAFTNLGQIIMDVFADAARATENAQVINGVGTTAPVGIFNTSAGYTIKTAAATPGYDDFTKTMLALPAAYRSASIWMMNTDALTLVATLKDGNGRPLFVPDPRELGEFVVLGHRVRVFDEIATATGKTKIAIGDWKNAYYLFDRQQLTMLTTNIGGTSFTTGTIQTRVDERFDGHPADTKAAIVLKDVAVS